MRKRHTLQNQILKKILDCLAWVGAVTLVGMILGILLSVFFTVPGAFIFLVIVVLGVWGLDHLLSSRRR